MTDLITASFTTGDELGPGAELLGSFAKGMLG